MLGLWNLVYYKFLASLVHQRNQKFLGKFGSQYEILKLYDALFLDFSYSLLANLIPSPMFSSWERENQRH